MQIEAGAYCLFLKSLQAVFMKSLNFFKSKTLFLDHHVELWQAFFVSQANVVWNNYYNDSLTNSSTLNEACLNTICR